MNKFNNFLAKNKTSDLKFIDLRFWGVYLWASMPISLLYVMIDSKSFGIRLSYFVSCMLVSFTICFYLDEIDKKYEKEKENENE